MFTKRFFFKPDTADQFTDSIRRDEKSQTQTSLEVYYGGSTDKIFSDTMEIISNGRLQSFSSNNIEAKRLFSGLKKLEKSET